MVVEKERPTRGGVEMMLKEIYLLSFRNEKEIILECF